jgi:glucose/arabinose dehydrogenase
VRNLARRIVTARVRGALTGDVLSSSERCAIIGPAQIVVVKLNEDGSFKSIATFLTGFIQNNNYVGRPADVSVTKDGSLLVSDDYNGAVYHISYGSQGLSEQ